jgi:5-methylcytosine-specific restriction endonuclease McrA
MPGSFCTVCRARIPRGSRCAGHRTVSPSARAWHQPGAAKIRERVLARDRHRCTRCGATERLEVHHVIPARDGGATTPANCVTLCADCHVAVERATV